MVQEVEPHPTRPLIDGLTRMPMRKLLLLVACQTVALALILGVSGVLEGGLSFVHTLLVPPLVTFVLIVAQPGLPGSRPLRVLGGYVVAGIFGIGLSILPFPGTVLGVVAGAIILFLFYLLGVFHAPAFAVPFAAIMAGYALSDAPKAFGILMIYTVLVIGLALATNRLLDYRSYPEKWW